MLGVVLWVARNMATAAWTDRPYLYRDGPIAALLAVVLGGYSALAVIRQITLQVWPPKPKGVYRRQT